MNWSLEARIRLLFKLYRSSHPRYRSSFYYIGRRILDIGRHSIISPVTQIDRSKERNLIQKFASKKNKERPDNFRVRSFLYGDLRSNRGLYYFVPNKRSPASPNPGTM
jgi:hypothetical protein